jgi:hypothetical protein
MSSHSFGRLGPYSSAAFSTLSASVASKLKDPSLVDSNGTGAGETFSVFDPGASAQQFEDGTAVIAQVRRMGRDDTKMVEYLLCLVLSEMMMCFISCAYKLSFTYNRQ